MRNLHVVVIGAGISGLACAQALLQGGATVEVFEKSRSLGGRLATRRWEGHVVDHGAPWFSLPEDDPFLKTCQNSGFPGQGMALVDTPELDRASGRPAPQVQGGRYYLPAGNNRLGKLLAPGVLPRMESTVEALESAPGGRWIVAGQVFDAVVLTAPWPQSRRLLRPWLDDETDAPEPEYSRTLTAFFEYPGDPSGPAAAWSGMTHDPDGGSPLARSVCENHKTGRIRPGCTVIVAHGTPDFSAGHFEAGREAWSAQLEARVREAWEFGAPPRAVFTHRWGFSTVKAPFPAPPVLPSGICLAGDAIRGSSIGDVWHSGIAAAHSLLA